MQQHVIIHMKIPLLLEAMLDMLGTLDLVQKTCKITGYLTEASGMTWTNYQD